MTPTCAFGRPWPGVHLTTGCRPCRKEADRLDAEFQRAVFLGEFNEAGYTEREWIASGRTRETWRTAACP